MTAALLDKPGIEAAERQVVALHLGSEIYGVDIACIHTVLMPQPITPLPNVSPDVKGVMNLRGRILPVLDLRIRFGMPPLADEKWKDRRIVIVEDAGLTAGIIVDAVSEVLRLAANSVEPSSTLLGAGDLRCLAGIGRVPGGRRKEHGQESQERLLLLLDIAQTLKTMGTVTMGTVLLSDCGVAA